MLFTLSQNSTTKYQRNYMVLLTAEQVSRLKFVIGREMVGGAIMVNPENHLVFGSIPNIDIPERS